MRQQPTLADALDYMLDHGWTEDELTGLDLSDFVSLLRLTVEMHH